MDTPLANGLFVFILGLMVVFFGMLVIVIAVSVCGKLLNKAADAPKKPVKEEKCEVAPQPAVVKNDEVPPHIKAAIVAVISAYYFENKSNCEFKVKKIKRI